MVEKNIGNNEIGPQEVPQEVASTIKNLAPNGRDLGRIISATNVATELFSAKRGVDREIPSQSPIRENSLNT